jgi:hypothetical protein
MYHAQSKQKYYSELIEPGLERYSVNNGELY